MAEFDKEVGKWRAVDPASGRCDVVVVEYAPAAKPGTFVNPRQVLQRTLDYSRMLAKAA